MKVDGAKVLGEISGLGAAEVTRLWREVQANSAHLAACVGPHDFQGDETRPGARLHCAKCGGEAPASAVHWYRLGLQHATR